MREKEIGKIDSGLVWAACRYYGGWADALVAAGIRPCYTPRIRWTGKMVLREISGRRKRGESLRATDVNRSNQKLYIAAGKFFGSYVKAVESLGLDYAEFGLARRRWSEDEIESEIKRLFKAGKPLNAMWMRENENALYLAAKKAHGSWEKALEAVGLDYNKIRKCEKWSPETVKDGIRKMFEGGEHIDAVYVSQNANKLFCAGQRYFGGWEKAVTAAGIDYGGVRVDGRKKWNRKKIIEKILAMKKRGESLNHGAAAGRDRNLVVAAVSHFGSWRVALEAAGIDYVDVCKSLKWTADDVTKRIRRLRADGANLVSTAMCRRNERLFNAAVAWFGSWEKAVRAAGIDYDEYRKIRRWSREKVVESLQERMKQGKKVTVSAVKKEDGGLHWAVYKYFGAWDEAVRAARDGLDFKEALSRVRAKTGGVWKNTRRDGRKKTRHKAGGSPRHAPIRVE